jgi:hypothetical protein
LTLIAGTFLPGIAGAAAPLRAALCETFTVLNSVVGELPVCPPGVEQALAPTSASTSGQASEEEAEDG